jgi:plastocyanin domain-containing protein
MSKAGIRAALAVAALAAVWGCGSGGREIKVVVNDQGFVPANIQVKKGQNVTLLVTRETNMTCATEIVIAAKGINQELPIYQPVRVSLGKIETDSLRFACGMDMVEGYVLAR